MRGRRLAIAIALGIGVGMSSVAAAGAFGAPHPERALTRPRNGHFTAMTETRSAASTPRSRVPGVEDACTGPTGTPALATRPSSIVIACADDGIGADDLSWTAWGASDARGKGVVWVHVCTPDCASSTTYRRYPATITLGDVVGTPTGPAFSVMSAAYPATGPRYPTGSLISRFTLASPRA